MRKILDVTTLTAEQRKHLLMNFSSLELLLRLVNELKPQWIPVLQCQTDKFLDEILALPEEEQLEVLQKYLSIDDD